MSRPNTKQPRSIPADTPAVWDLVFADMQERDLMGKKKHGVRLQPGNGRDVLKDAYQEALDLVAYLRQSIYERDEQADIATLEQEIKQVRARLARVEGEHAGMLAALIECDDEMGYMSQYDIPICLPGHVKAAIANVKETQ